MATFREIVTDSMIELGVLQANETPSAEDAAWVLRKLVRLFDQWNAYRPAVFCENFTTFSFVPSQQAYTIGPSGADLTATIRPVTLDGVNVILNNVSPVVRNPCNLRDWQWWQYNAVQGVTSSFPTDVYYKPSYPLGVVTFWPVPTVAYGFELVTRTLVDESITLAGTFSMPQGYLDAAIFSLAESCIPSFGTVSGETAARISKAASEARAKVFANNDFSGRLATVDAGMPQSVGVRSTFNYRTGLNTPGAR